MSYMVSATRGRTAMVSSTCSAAEALEWIRKRRAVGADHFHIVDNREHQLNESELAVLAKDE